VRQVRDRKHELADLLLEAALEVLEALDLGGELGEARHQPGVVLAAALHLPDRAAVRVAPGLLLLEVPLHEPVLLVEPQELLELGQVGLHHLRAHGAPHDVGVLADEAQVEHGSQCTSLLIAAPRPRVSSCVTGTDREVAQC